MCKDTIVGDEIHPGCACTSDFSGDHCEFTPETAPKMSSASSTNGSSSSSQSVPGSQIEVIAFSFLVSAIALSVLVVAFFVVRHARRDRRMSSAQKQPIDDPIEIDADGGSMPSASETRLELTPTPVTDPDVDGEFI